MIVPQGQVSREEVRRVCDPVIGRGVARASDPHDDMVVLNLDHEALAQQWSPPEREPLIIVQRRTGAHVPRAGAGNPWLQVRVPSEFASKSPRGSPDVTEIG